MKEGGRFEGSGDSKGEGMKGGRLETGGDEGKGTWGEVRLILMRLRRVFIFAGI